MPRTELSSLLSLSRFPGIDLLIPHGVDAHGLEISTLEILEGGPDLGYRVHEAARGRVAQPFAPLGFQIDEHRTWFDPASERSIKAVFGKSEADAQRLAREIASHTALGRDYFVEPDLGAARAWSRRAWFNQVGICTYAEALRLAGSKSRLYRFVPEVVLPEGIVSTTTGRLIDLAAIHFTPGLRRAIAGSLSAGSTAAAADCAPHLIAVRSRLIEILVARDEIFRLGRGEAIGPRRTSSMFDARDATGRAGNELTVQLAYHLAAALNSLYAATDNLAWVLAKRAGLAAPDRDPSFSTLVDPGRRRPDWRRNPDVEAAVRSVMASPSLPFVLAARTLRNALMHNDGLSYGWVEWATPSNPSIDGVSALWITRDQLAPRSVFEQGSVDLFDAVGRVAEYRHGDLVIATFPRLADEIWCAASALMGAALRSVEWGPTRWAQRGRGRPASGSRWTNRVQRHLWGVSPR